MLDRVTPTEYIIQGKRFDRVTTVLDRLSGLGSPGPAAGGIVARELSIAASDLCVGIIPRATRITTPQEFAEFMASDEGKKWIAGRYFSGMGDLADTGTMVDQAFQQIAEHGALFDEKDAIDWVMAERDAINASRELTKVEYEKAVSEEDLPKVEELKGQPRYPANIDIHGAARRIVALGHWWIDSGLECVQTQGTLKDSDERVAGTFDLLAKAKDGSLVLIDLKTGKSNSPQHAAQVAKYAEMLKLPEDSPWWLVYARYDDEKRESKVYRYDVADKEKAQKLWRWALAMHRFSKPGLFGRAKTYGQKEMANAS